MALYYEADGVTLLLGDCRQVMRELPAESVSCIVTSPPFWGLRKYECPDSVWADGWRGQLGLEPTVQLYIEHTMEWIREVRRVLRSDGVFWLDIGDSRGGSWGNYAPTGKGGQRSKATERWERKGQADVTFCPPTSRVLPKSLCLIPQRIALACQDDGWIVRNYGIIKTWMPESCKDRMTRNYRVLLMLTKGPRYWSDFYAVRAPLKESSIERISQATLGSQQGGPAQKGEPYQGTGNANRCMDMVRSVASGDGLRNLGDLWDDLPCANWPSGPGFEHFATFCVEEPLRAIRASCPEAICMKCGKPRVRMVKTKRIPEDGGSRPQLPEGPRRLSVHRDALRRDGHPHDNPFQEAHEEIGWTDCGCGAGWVSGVTLDPFIGTGTTAIAARMLGRRAIGIDASEDYLKQAVTRLTVGDSGIRRMVAARRAGAEQGVMF